MIRPAASTTSIRKAWLADVLARLPDHPAHRVGELLPWAWKASQEAATNAATALAA